MGGTIQDEAGNDATLTHEAVEADPEHLVDGVRPTFSSATTSEDGTTVTVTFTEDIQVSPMLAAFINSKHLTVETYQFIVSVLNVEVNRTWPTQTAATISGDTVTVTMDTAVDSDDDVRVRYDGVYARHTPAILMDMAGNAMANFGANDATNNSTNTESSGAGNVRLSVREMTVSRESVSGADPYLYSVWLGSEPSGDVTVAVTSNSVVTGSVNPTSLTFTTDDWNQQQDITVAPAGDETYDVWVTVTHTASGSNYSGEDSIKILIQD